MEKEKTVTIVGSGISGLAAATTLHKKGFKVTVLEGRNRVGGRTFTNPDLNIDWGAGWIHGSVVDEVYFNPLLDLAKNHGVSPFFVGGDSSYIGGVEISQFYNSLPVIGAEKQKGFDDLEKLYEDLESLGESLKEKNMGDISVFDAIQIVAKNQDYSPSQIAIFNWHLSVIFGGDYATETNKMSLFWLLEHYIDYLGGDFVIPGGYSTIIEKMAKGIDIRLGDPVTKIDYRSNHIQVVTNNGNVYTSDQVIVTLPIGVLQENKVEFVPELPNSKLNAMNNLGKGCLNKVILVFDQVFWPKEQYTFAYMSDKAGEYPMIINLIKSDGLPMLLFMVAGDEGERIEKLSDEEVSIETMKIVRAMFGRDAPEPKKVFVTRWLSDPFALCSYGFPKVGASLDTYKKLAEPVENRVLFAGEHTVTQFYGTVHGAYFSGLREAARVSSDEELYEYATKFTINSKE